jgi:hypothetical protein
VLRAGFYKRLQFISLAIMLSWPIVSHNHLQNMSTAAVIDQCPLANQLLLGASANCLLPDNLLLAFQPFSADGTQAMDTVGR